jgi:hypothetical protein
MCVHFLCDYPLQGEYLAKTKNRTLPENEHLWYHSLTAHASIHAFGVLMVTGSWLAFAIEAVTHWIIDDAKCRGKLSYTDDQIAHAMVMFLIAGLMWCMGG